jgi:hypothetical protein
MKLEKKMIVRSQILNAFLFSMMLLSIGCSSPDETKTTDKADAPNQTSPMVTDLKTDLDDSEQLKKLAVGDMSPDFEVELMGGEMLKLSDHVKSCSGPTILLFDRAHW